MWIRRLKRVIFIAGMICLPALQAQNPEKTNVVPSRPQGPCDIYAAAGDACVAAHSTTRALYQSYGGPLYQVLRQSDGKTLEIAVVPPGQASTHDEGGYADAAAQDAFCANTYCFISKIYDQSPKHNDLTQAPRGGFSGPALGGLNNLPLADMAPVTISGHKVYGVFIEPGMGLRIDDPRGTAVDDQAEGQYWVINGLHYNSGCCFDYGNAEIDSRDDDNGTMETAYYGDSTGWIHGNPPGPWIMTDQENNLVGCVSTNGAKLCPHLPDIKWRFVTAMAKGEPHHWTSLGGDAQQGSLAVMFDGQRVDSSYDPMRKQGAILLGNGGDNSNGSQGTFYEGAVTASGTFPTDATDQLIQANVVAARYGVQQLSVAPAASQHNPGVQTFTPGSSRDTLVTFTNMTGLPVRSLALSLAVPDEQWTAFVRGTTDSRKSFPETIKPGDTVTVTFTITPGSKPFNGDVVAHASWTSEKGGTEQTESMAEKVRSAAPVKINEIRMSSGSAGNATDSFIELYNVGASEVDLSGWTLTERPAQQAIFSTITVPAGTRLTSKGFHLLGLSNSGLAVPARAGDTQLNVRSTTGISVGDVLSIGTGSDTETRKVLSLGTAATDHTTLWQPLPDGPITLDPGSTNVPVQSVSGFKVGEKIALGYGASTAYVGSGTEQYEIATVTAVGKEGTQAYLATDAPAGATNLKVTSVSDITAGDKIRLDIDSPTHGIETIIVAIVGTKASQTNLTANVIAGATQIKVRRSDGFVAGDKIAIGTPSSQEFVTVTSVANEERTGASITFAPALSSKHGRDEWVVAPGSGLTLAAPLRFSHAANLPFSDRGTGVTFQPATRLAHLSDEPIQALGSGIRLDRALAKDHPVNAVVHDDKVVTAGYQGAPRPNQWFGGPELTTRSLLFGRTINVREGSMVLRDALGLVVDSLNYGGLVDPWAAKGYQALSGPHEEGCFVPSPDVVSGSGSTAGTSLINRSANRFPDGADTDSNCTDFVVQPATTLPMGSVAGSDTIRVTSVAGFHPGDKIIVDSGADTETAMISNVGSAGATTIGRDVAAGAVLLPVVDLSGFESEETVTVGSGADAETVIVSAIHRFSNAGLTTTAPLMHAHAAGSQVSGTGLRLTSALLRGHVPGAQVAENSPTPGAANRLEAEATPGAKR